MLTITSIQTGFSELGAEAENKSFSSIQAADAFFQRIELRCRAARAKRRQLGYYKTDFRITWSDGNTYDGRFDFGSEDKATLSGHIIDFAEFYSGQRRPSHFTNEMWESFCKASADTFVAYKEFLDKYGVTLRA